MVNAPNDAGKAYYQWLFLMDAGSWEEVQDWIFWEILNAISLSNFEISPLYDLYKSYVKEL